MIFIIMITTLLVIFLAGSIVVRCTNDNKIKENSEYYFVMGSVITFSMIGFLAVAMQLIRCDFKQFMLVATVLSALIGIVGLFCLISLLKRDKIVFGRFEKQDIWIWIGIIALIVFQVYKIVVSRPDMSDDISLQIARTTIYSNSIQQIHPLTGQVLEYGTSNSGKLVVLPILYAYISSSMGQDPILLVTYLAPIGVLLLSYCVAHLISRECMDTKRKRAFFILAYALLVTFGDYTNTVFGYRLIYKGFSGETIVSCVLVPFIMYLFLSKVSHKLIPIMLSLISSVMLTGISFGIAYLLPCIGICIMVKVIFMIRRRLCKKS